MLGCTDSSANNFDSAATENDGSCSYAVFGCTDSNYGEYNSLATDDDGSCVSLIGCTDSNYYEYDSAVVINEPTACISKKGDYNLDGIVNNADLFIVLGNWLSSGENVEGDLNGDNIVNNSDLFDVLGNWLE